MPEFQETYEAVIAVRYPELDAATPTHVIFRNYLADHQAAIGGFLPVFWRFPHNVIHATVDLGQMVEWISKQLPLEAGENGCLAVLQNRNDMAGALNSSEWVERRCWLQDADLKPGKVDKEQHKYWWYVSPVRSYFDWLLANIAYTFCNAALDAFSDRRYGELAHFDEEENPRFASMTFQNIYHIGDTKSGQELEVFLLLPLERLRLGCGIQCTETMLPPGPQQRPRLFTAAVKLLRFAIGIDTVPACNPAEQTLLKLQDEYMLATLSADRLTFRLNCDKSIPYKNVDSLAQVSAWIRQVDVALEDGTINGVFPFERSTCVLSALSEKQATFTRLHRPGDCNVVGVVYFCFRICCFYLETHIQ